MTFSIKVTIEDNGLTAVQKAAPGIDNIIAEGSAEAIQTNAISRAAVRTGYMRDHISRTVVGPWFFVEAEADYSGFVEYGTRYMAAQPFMTPAAEETDYDAICQDALKKVGF